MVNPAAQIAPVTAIWRGAETAAESLRGTVGGLNATVGQQAHEMVEAAQASRQYQLALENVRAQFNPLFAASRQYEQQLERIALAERDGAISAREAAQARMQAAQIILQERITESFRSQSMTVRGECSTLLMFMFIIMSIVLYLISSTHL